MNDRAFYVVSCCPNAFAPTPTCNHTPYVWIQPHIMYTCNHTSCIHATTHHAYIHTYVRVHAPVATAPLTSTHGHAHTLANMEKSWTRKKNRYFHKNSNSQTLHDKVCECMYVCMCVRACVCVCVCEGFTVRAHSE